MALLCANPRLVISYDAVDLPCADAATAAGADADAAGESLIEAARAAAANE